MRRITLVGFFMVVCLACSPCGSQATITLSPTVLGVGGGVSSSASLTVLGALGQPVAGLASGPSLSIHAGFVPCLESPGTSNASGDERLLATRLRVIAPNPFRERTSIGFDLAGPARTTVRIYDVAGRLIRTLLDESLGPGTYNAEWDGQGPGGARVGAGVYYCRLSSGGAQKTQKLTVIE